MDKFEIINILDGEKWDEIVKSFPNYDVYYLSGYVKAFQVHGDGNPLLLYYQSDSLRAIYVTMKRDVSDSSFFSGIIQSKTYYDFITPYGYGGILFDGDCNQSNLKKFGIKFSELLKEEKIISDFVRYHPLLNNADGMRPIAPIIDLGKTISMNLENKEIIWENISSKNRNMIRKAEKSGVEIFFGKSLELFDKFSEIYNLTMDKDNAHPYYYFKKEFYKSIHNELNDNYEMFYAVYEKQIVAMSIIIFANNRMHYHLSGSLVEYKHLAPSNLLLYKAACWGYEQGFSEFHLGGGVGSGRDGLYKFKEAFNRKSCNQFSIGKNIIDNDKYDYLVSLRKKMDLEFNESSLFFPLYRS